MCSLEFYSLSLTDQYKFKEWSFPSFPPFMSSEPALAIWPHASWLLAPAGGWDKGAILQFSLRAHTKGLEKHLYLPPFWRRGPPFSIWGPCKAGVVSCSSAHPSGPLASCFSAHNHTIFPSCKVSPSQPSFTPLLGKLLFSFLSCSFCHCCI